MKFIVDSMAGKLAKWLRLLGFDAVYERSGDIDKIVERAEREGRIILTRNTRFLDVKTDAEIFFLDTEKTYEQVKEVVKHFDLARRIKPFSRCIECNELLEHIDKKKVKGRVPYHIYKIHDTFTYCPGCKRIYWSGSHRTKLEERIKKLLRDIGLGDEPAI